MAAGTRRDLRAGGGRRQGGYTPVGLSRFGRGVRVATGESNCASARLAAF